MKDNNWWKNNKWFVLLGVLILIINFIRVLNRLSSSELQNFNLTTFVLILSVTLYALFSAFVTIIPISIFVILGYYIYFKSSTLDRNKKESFKKILFTSTIFGALLFTSLYGISDFINYSLYPYFIRQIIGSTHPDDPITSTFTLTNYGAVIGLIFSIIYGYLKKLFRKR